MQDDTLLYGGEGAADLHPEFVPTNMWHIASEFDPAFNGTVRRLGVNGDARA